MSLPFAGPPEESQIYTDLKGVKLADLTADQFDQLRERLFSEGVNGTEDEYRRLLLLGQAGQKVASSGPIPGSMKIVSVSYDDNQYYTLIEPGKGEVYQLINAFIFTATGFTGANFSLIETASPGTIVHIADVASGGGDITDHGLPSPVYIDETCKFTFYPQGTLSSTSSCQAAFIRVR